MSSCSENPVDNLQLGLGIELAVLPPYLYALWSIKPESEGASIAALEASNAFRAVIYEEMLHAALVANIVKSLGHVPDVARHLLTYPSPLPGHVSGGPHAFVVELRPLSREALATFMRIEQPEFPVPKTAGSDTELTVVEFYRRLEQQLQQYADQFRQGRQLPRANGPSPGRLMEITDLDSALKAIDVIVDQGEGHLPSTPGPQSLFDADHEVAHFFQFRVIDDYLKNGVIAPHDVYQVIDNPDASKYTAPQQAANQRFNEIYTGLIDSLQATLSSDTPSVFGGPTSYMRELGHAAAVLRSAGNVPHTQFVAGPTFEYLSHDQVP